MLGPVGLKLSRARTDQRGTWSDVSEQSFLGLEFGIPYTVVSDNGKEFVSKDLKDWLAAQGCKKIDTPLYSPRSNGLAERAVQTLKRSLKFYNKDIGCSLTTYIDKILFSNRNSSNARGDTPAKLLLGKNLRNPVVGFF